MKKQKRLTSSCAITIPKDIRANYGMFAGNGVDLLETNDGILIRKHVAACFCCGTAENVKTHNGLELCTDCAKKFI